MPTNQGLKTARHIKAKDARRQPQLYTDITMLSQAITPSQILIQASLLESRYVSSDIDRIESKQTDINSNQPDLSTANQPTSSNNNELSTISEVEEDIPTTLPPVKKQQQSSNQ
jgi:CRISPR/Cas system-associated protein Cas7 (RAMP superfamily)